MKTKTAAKCYWQNFLGWINRHYSLIGILVGSALILFTSGPFTNWDSTTEFQAATGVIQWGKPYYRLGDIINQPPLGFYIEALFFKTFGIGTSQQTAVTVTTLFGLGCIFMLYKLGEAFYGKRAGLFAASLFALTPWQVVIARTFLIDSQCLFFSLLYLVVGIWAIRKDSVKLWVVASFFFATALLTKAFAVFMLVPLGLFYFSFHQKKVCPMHLLFFFLPAVAFLFLWYQVLSGLSILTFVRHDDFFTFNTISFPSLFFVGNFLRTTLGVFFLITAVLSAGLVIARKKLFSVIRRFDIICLVTIIFIAVFNTILAVGFNLKVPYFNPVKYDYQLLPFLCLLAASILPKCGLIFSSVGAKFRRIVLLLIACSGIIALGVAMCVNMAAIGVFHTSHSLVFLVEGEVGYTFYNLAQTNQVSNLVYIQYVGFMLIVSNLLLSCRDLVERQLNGGWRACSVDA